MTYYLRNENLVLSDYNYNKDIIETDEICDTTRFVRALVFTTRKDAQDFLKQNWQLTINGWKVYNSLDYEY